MAFFWGRLSRPDEPRETPFKYLTFGVVGVDWISHPRDAVAKTAFRPRLPSPPPPSPPSCMGLFKYTLVPCRVSHHGGEAFNGTFIRRSGKIFANVKRKEEAFSGLAFCPWLNRLLPTTRPRWPGQFVGFLTQNLETRVVPFSGEFSGKNRLEAG